MVSHSHGSSGGINASRPCRLSELIRNGLGFGGLGGWQHERVAAVLKCRKSSAERTAALSATIMAEAGGVKLYMITEG